MYIIYAQNLNCACVSLHNLQAREAKIRGNTTVKDNYERAACTLNCGALVVSLIIVGCLVASVTKAYF